MAQLKTRFSGLLVLACVLALLVASAAPAFAHHKDDHSQGGENFQEADKDASDNDGDADSDSSSTQTENDSDPRENDPEDQADEGDNAHPSGKDRSVENGKSTKNPNQGKAESNPDDSKGPQRFEGGRGDDKPNGPGGVDAADQDGNNGCGNDDDFDDDNNGHCGGARRNGGTGGTGGTDGTDGNDGNGGNGGGSGNSSADMTIEVDCFSVRVTSSKDISNVKVTFVDGTMQEINVNAPTFSQAFSKQIAFATSKSGTTTVSDSAPESCGGTVGGSQLCPAGTDNAGKLMDSVESCDEVESRGSVLCPAGTDNAGKPMDSVESCNEDDVEGRVDESNPIKVCPSGPYEGMPFMDEEDCEVASDGDRVSPNRIVRAAVAGTVDAARRAARALGAALPFTGTGDLVVIAGLAVLLIAGGTMALRTRSTK